MKTLACFALIATMSLTYTAPARTPATPSVPLEHWLYGAAGYERAVAMQRESNLPLVVYFYADWCPYCRTLDNQYLPSAEVQDYLRGVIKVRINPEQGTAERALGVQYGVKGYPSFFVIRHTSSPPVAVHAFRKRAPNLTPAQFANACRTAGSASRNGLRISRASGRFSEKGADTRTAAANSKPTTSGGAPIATVKRVSANSPRFIAEDALPSVDEVLAKYVDAVGGRAAQMRLSSRVTKGRVDVPGVSYGGRLETYAKAPNKALTVMKFDTNVIRQCFDGKDGWEQSAQSGVRKSTGEGLAAFARDAEFYGAIRLKAQYESIKLLGKLKQGSSEAYLIEATPRGGSPEMFYFDTQSGLLLRRDVTRPTRHGLVRAEVYLNDWREVDGVKLPFKLTQMLPGLTFVFTLEEVRHNVEVDDAIFRRPPGGQ